MGSRKTSIHDLTHNCSLQLWVQGFDVPSPSTYFPSTIVFIQYLLPSIRQSASGFHGPSSTAMCFRLIPALVPGPL